MTPIMITVSAIRAGVHTVDSIRLINYQAVGESRRVQSSPPTRAIRAGAPPVFCV